MIYKIIYIYNILYLQYFIFIDENMFGYVVDLCKMK